jgi:hypothetical protein
MPYLPVGVSKFFGVHVAAHKAPFLAGDISFDEISLGKVPVGNIHGQHFGHGNACAGCHQFVKHRRALERVIKWRIRPGKFDSYFDEGLSELYQQHEVIGALIGDGVFSNGGVRSESAF